jgi:hypothetical protein
MSAILKSIVSGSPAKRVEKLESKLTVLDSRIGVLAAEAAAIDGGEDPAGVVAAGATLATARAERLVLARALEGAQRIVAQAVAAEAVAAEAARRARLLAEAEAAGKDLEEALVGVCAPLGRFNALVDLLDADRPKLGIEDYCLAASEIACKDVPRWPARGNAGADTRSVALTLTVPVAK